MLFFFSKPSPRDPLGRECEFGDSGWERAEIKEGHRFSMLFDQNGGATGIPALRCCAAAAVIILRGTHEKEKPFKTRSSSPGWVEVPFHPLNFSLAPSAGRADTREA